MNSTRSIVFAALVLVALLAAEQITFAQQPPPCPTTGRLREVTYGDVTVTLPDNAPLCPAEQTGGCCDSITITGLTEGWTVTGPIDVYFLFTTQYPPGDPNARQLIAHIDVNETVGSTGTVTIGNICYPPAHSWPTAELHVDLALLVADNGVPVSGIGSDPTIPGVIGPGLGGWDPVCYHLGCTPGYWKTHPLAWEGVSPSDLFSNVFGVPGKPVWDTDLTMLEATMTGGGGEYAMVRHCAAAYVGAKWAAAQPNLDDGPCVAWLNETVTPAEVVEKVQDAYEGIITFDVAHAFCASANEEALCGPNGPWLNTTTAAYGGAACILGYSGPATPPSPPAKKKK